MKPRFSYRQVFGRLWRTGGDVGGTRTAAGDERQPKRECLRGAAGGGWCTFRGRGKGLGTLQVAGEGTEREMRGK